MTDFRLYTNHFRRNLLILLADTSSFDLITCICALHIVGIGVRQRFLHDDGSGAFWRQRTHR